MDKKCQAENKVEGIRITCNKTAYMEAMDGKVYCEQHLAEDTPTLYTIKPLEWEGDNTKAFAKNGDYSYAIYIFANCPKYSYWCYGGSKGMPCTSIEDGKAQAWEHYEKKIKECLEVYDVE